MQWLGCTHGSRLSISREGTEGNGHPIPIPVRPSPLPAIPSIVPPPQTDFSRAGRLSTEAALRRSCLARLSLSLSLACAHTLIFSSLMIPAFLFLVGCPCQYHGHPPDAKRRPALRRAASSDRRREVHGAGPAEKSCVGEVGHTQQSRWTFYQLMWLMWCRRLWHLIEALSY